ncbi:hypothetical protein ACU8KH_01123 [Lachancea thermotolerans]
MTAIPRHPARPLVHPDKVWGLSPGRVSELEELLVADGCRECGRNGPETHIVSHAAVVRQARRLSAGGLSTAQNGDETGLWLKCVKRLLEREKRARSGRETGEKAQARRRKARAEGLLYSSERRRE